MKDEVKLDQAYLNARRNRLTSKNYHTAAFLAYETGTRMFSRFNYIKYQPNTIVDLGAATGLFSQQLMDYYPASRLIAVDTAPTLLKTLSQKAWWKKWIFPKRFSLLNAEMIALPLPNASIDLIWSNLSLLGQDTPDKALAECHRILPVGGLLMFCTLGPDTLKELRAAFLGVDTYQHVHDFIDMHDIGDALIRQGFSSPVMDMERLTVTYDSLTELFWDLKHSGMNNASMNRRLGFMGKATWQKMLSQYEVFRQNGELPASFEVIYGHAWKGEPKMPKAQQSITFYPRENNII